MPDATLDLSVPHLIRNGELQANDWREYAPAEGEETASAVPADEPHWIVTLATWKAERDVLRARRNPVGVLLPPDADLADLLGGDTGTLDTTGIALIAVEFPAYTDGRGYSLAQLLRTRHGYTGELRAVGDVMIDTIHYQARVGFDSFLVKAGHDPYKALAAFKTFSVHYQKTYLVPA
ncbi:DUF934 domain-containing protein [Bordetella genomosp. 13]|uniref:DUF934 domain-containing protein n=1 Tax=Bordetella genomosp. 13 TaxID=463040 RepID=UPI0011A69C0C|nr:DUF934 domain-containing protein [Bordetella genomosp. 13]